MATPVPKPGAMSRALTQLPLDLSELPVRLTQADFARLIGCSRAHVSGLVSRQVIPVKPGGKIDPSEAFAALLQRDPDVNRLKVLIDIRRQIDEAKAEAAEARELAAQGQARLDEMEGLAGRLCGLALRESRRFGAMIECLYDLFPNDDDEPLIDRTTERAHGMAEAPDRNPFRLADEDLGRLVVQLQPGMSRAFADAWSVAAADLSEAESPGSADLLERTIPLDASVPPVAEAALAKKGAVADDLDKTESCPTGRKEL